MDPAEQGHERHSEKSAQKAAAITSPVSTGPQAAFPLIYRKKTSSLETWLLLGLRDGWNRIYGVILRHFAHLSVL